MFDIHLVLLHVLSSRTIVHRRTANGSRLLIGTNIDVDLFGREQLGVVRPGTVEVGQPHLLASGDEGLRQVRNAKKNGEPSGVIQAGARILYQDSGGDVIQRGEAVDPVPMVLGETRSHPSTSVMTDDQSGSNETGCGATKSGR